jgi:hypothetical protein
VLQPAFDVVALLLPDDRDRRAAEAGETGNERLVLAERTVARERREVGEERADIVEAMRPVRMPGDQRLLPRRELALDVALRVFGAPRQASDLIADLDRLAVLGELFQFEDLAFEIGDGLFEIEIIIHSPSGTGTQTMPGHSVRPGRAFWRIT